MTRTRALRPLLAWLAIALCAVAGCGGDGDGRDEVVQAVRDFAEAANERDAERFCNELVTQEFLEQATLATGDVRGQCRDNFEALQRPQIEIVSIERTQVEGDRALVTARIEVGDEPREQTFELVKEDGEFRVNSG